jgi:hypothetical protein
MERLREQIVGLVDADWVRPEDEGGLLAALDAVRRALAAGDTPGARAGLEGFIAEAQRLMTAGALEGRADDAPLTAARALLAALGIE